MDLPDTKSWIERLKNHDEAAFTTLVETAHPRLLAVARSITGDTWADEVVQDAWISIYRALPDFEGRSSLDTWLYTIVRNSARSRLRKEKRQVSLDSALDASGMDDVEQLLNSRFSTTGSWQQKPGNWGTEDALALMEAEQLQNCIASAMEGLTTLQKAVLRLHDLDRLKPLEVCNILDISHSNQRVLLHRARLVLRQAIDRYMETGEC